MINSVEFILMFLSMFSSVTTDSVAAAGFLFQLALSYDICLQRFPMRHGTYECVLRLIDPLSALAKCCGFDLKLKDNCDPTVMEAYDMLCAILDPILKRLSLAELAEIEYSAMEGATLFTLPLEELGLTVENWTRRTRVDGCENERFRNLPAPGSVGTLSAGLSTLATGSPLDDDTGDINIDRNGDIQWWSRIKMDEQIAAAVMSYCNHYAAAPTETSLKRTRRVAKCNMAVSNTTWYTGSDQEAQLGPNNIYSTLDNTLDSSASFQTDSSGLCVGFSPSGNTLTYYTNPRNAPSTGFVMSGLSSNSCGHGSEGGCSIPYDEEDVLHNRNSNPMEPKHSKLLQNTGWSSRETSYSKHLHHSKSAPAVVLSSFNATDATYQPHPTILPLDLMHSSKFGIEIQSTYEPYGLIPADRLAPTNSHIPRTPTGHNTGAFDYEPWILPNTTDVEEISCEDEMDLYEPATAVPSLESNSTSTPAPDLRIVKRKIGAYNLRNVAATHEVMEQNNYDLPPTSSELRDVLLEQRTLQASYNTSSTLDEYRMAEDSMDEPSLSEALVEKPRLAGYYELQHAYYEKNGIPRPTPSTTATIRTATDSPSLLTPRDVSTPELIWSNSYSPYASSIFTDYAFDWAEAENLKWHNAIRDKKRRYVSDVIIELPEPSMVKKMAEGMRRGFSALFAR